MGSQVWVVVAAFEEEARLGATLDALRAHQRDVVVVDDGSSDRTAEVARRRGVWVLSHLTNRGQGAALQTGIDFALSRGAGVIVTFDADGQHDPAEIERVAAPVLAGEVDVALGSRFLGRTVGMPCSRRIVLKLGVLFTRLLSGLRVTDVHNGLRALSADAARRIRITQDRMAHASELVERIRALGLSFREVPVTVRYTAESLAKGQGNWNAVKIAGQMILGRLVR